MCELYACAINSETSLLSLKRSQQLKSSVKNEWSGNLPNVLVCVLRYYGCGDVYVM